MATYDNDLRLKEIATGDEEGTWGASTNVNLELIAEAFSYDTLAITGSQNLTMTDGGTAAARALFLKVTGTLSGNATLTIDPNSVSKVWAIQNATTGGYSLILSQGSGSTVTVAASRTKIIYSDGGGASANVVEVTTALDLSSFTAGNTTLISSILDEDNMASDSATALATQQSIKAYVDSQVTAQDLDFAGDTGTGAVDLDSQTFTVAGTSNEVETSASAQTITIGLPANVTVTTALTTPTVKATNLSANDGTASASIANSTGVMTVASSVLTTTDINAGTIDGTTIGGSSAAAATVTTLTANTNLTIAGTTTVDGIIDDDTMATASATKLATSESIKTYVDNQVGTVDTLAEILANGNTSGGTNLIMSAGDTLTADTIAETTLNAGVTIDSVLLKDDVVNATDIEVGTISANDGVQSAVIANTTGVMTIASSVLTTTDINGGTIDGTTIGGATPAVGTFTTANATTVDTTNLEVTTIKAKDGTSAGSIADVTGVVTLASSVLTTTDINGGTVDGAVVGGASAAAGTFTTLTANTNLTIAGTTTVNGVIDDDTMATASATKLATSESIKAYVDSQVTAQDLDFAGDSGTGQVDLDSQTFTIAGTANEIETSASGQTITVGLPNSVTIASDLTIAKTTGQLIAANSATTGGVYQRFSNTSGSVVVGLESSTGGSIISGTSANAAIIGTDLAQSVQICTNNAPNLTIASGGAATFSNSLSVTGNLTVDTDTLFVDATNNRVGIGTTSPTETLDVKGTGNFNNVSGTYLGFQYNGTQVGYVGTANAIITGGATTDFGLYAQSAMLFSSGGGTERMRIDTSGNLGLGVTPSAWDATGAGGPVLQIKRGLLFGSDTEARLIHNAYYGTGSFRYIASGVAATAYQQQSGQHIWYTAASGTAGNAISFTQAMTLDSNGRLGIGTPGPLSSKFTVSSTGSSIELKQSAAGAATYYVMDNTVETGGKRWRFGYTGAASIPTFSLYNETDAVTAWVVDATGNLGIGVAGIDRLTVGPFSGSNAVTIGGGTTQYSSLYFGDGPTGSDRYRGYIEYEHSSDSLLFGTASTRKMIITPGGDVGIGTAGAPAKKLEIASGDIRIGDGYTISWGDDSYRIFRNGTYLRFDAAGTERARITSGGFFKASDSGTYASSTGSFHELRSSAASRTHFQNSHASTPYGILVEYTATTPNNSGNEFIYCADPTAARAYIRSDGGLANYQANNANLSDERVKTDIKPLGSMWDKLKAIEVVAFKYKDQTHDDDNIGVIAQQVESVAPEFVDIDGFGKERDDDVPLKTVYTTDLYHASIKALQEAMIRIEELDAKVSALQSN